MASDRATDLYYKIRAAMGEGGDYPTAEIKLINEAFDAIREAGRHRYEMIFGQDITELVKNADALADERVKSAKLVEAGNKLMGFVEAIKVLLGEATITIDGERKEIDFSSLDAWRDALFETFAGGEVMWISVKDSLPEYGVEVLVEVDGHRGPSWRNNHNLVAYLAKNNNFYEERHESNIPLPVTHWMPLPEPPKGE